jgi:hypothetical protein
VWKWALKSDESWVLYKSVWHGVIALCWFIKRNLSRLGGVIAMRVCLISLELARENGAWLLRLTKAGDGEPFWAFCLTNYQATRKGIYFCIIFFRFHAMLWWVLFLEEFLATTQRNNTPSMVGFLAHKDTRTTPLGCVLEKVKIGLDEVLWMGFIGEWARVFLPRDLVAELGFMSPWDVSSTR